jgi:hypothetical protein
MGEGGVPVPICRFTVAWAWMSYSWFASAYDNDDWVFRVATMVQMVGVIVLALGIEEIVLEGNAGGGVGSGLRCSLQG